MALLKKLRKNDFFVIIDDYDNSYPLSNPFGGRAREQQALFLKNNFVSK